MRGEEAVERQRGALAGRGEGEIAVQRRIVRIADRRNGGQAVDRAAQDHDNEPRIARARRARRPRCRSLRRTGRSRRARPRRGPGRGGRFEFRQARGSSSSPLEFGRHEQKRQRLLARFGARDRLARVLRRRVAEDCLQGRERIDVPRSIRWPMNQARSSRNFMPSGDDQASLESEKPLGPAGCHSGMPSRLSAWR